MERTNRGDSCSAPDIRLAALLDGELRAPEHQALQAHLRVCSLCREDLAQQRLAREALRRMAVTLTASLDLHERVQARLRHAASRPSRRWLLLLGGVAAALILIALGLYLALRQPLDAGQLAQAADIHVQETLSEAPVSFASADPAAVQAWSRAQTGRDVDIPSLAAAGYQLLGARLEPSAGPDAVTLVYEGPAGRLTCMILPPPAPAWLGPQMIHPIAHAAQLRGVSVADWADRDGIYVMVAEATPTALLHVAQSAINAGS